MNSCVDAAFIGGGESHRHNRLITGARPYGVFTYGHLLCLLHLNGRAPIRHPVAMGSETVSLSCFPSLRNAGIVPASQARQTHPANDPGTCGPLPDRYQHLSGLNRVYRWRGTNTVPGRLVRLRTDRCFPL
ncbi:MAG: hypothetical protein HKM93_15575 [Desulfobacteraceae bacterium]|nr:hypothetical protein [Desulfobacteraceae bacterium]